MEKEIEITDVEKHKRHSWNGKGRSMYAVCSNCGWVSQYPQDFINRYKEKWNK